MRLPAEVTRQANSLLQVFRHANITFSDGQTWITRSGTYNNTLAVDGFTDISSIEHNLLDLSQTIMNP